MCMYMYVGTRNNRDVIAIINAVFLVRYDYL